MINERQETIAGIVAEMRKRAEEVYAGQAGYPESWKDQMNDDEIRDLADRIEAAHKREVAELRECLKETMVVAISEYHYNSCFKHVKCGEIERCKTCKVTRWIKALKGASND